MEITQEYSAIFYNPLIFFELPNDLQEYFLLKSDLNSIKNLCLALSLYENPEPVIFLEGLCSSYRFWRKKLRQDFVLDYRRILDGDTWTKNKDKLEYWKSQYENLFLISGARMIAAARVGDVNGINEALNLGVDPNTKDARGYTALVYATENGHNTSVQKLLEVGADPNVILSSIDEWTPLIIASSEGYIDIVRNLLENGADIDFQSSDKETALIRATIEGHVDIVQELLENKANVDLRDDEGNTALDEALNRGYDEIVELLRSIRGDSMSPNVPNNVVNKELYIKIRDKVKNRVKVWPSAYASGQVVSEYKRAGGQYRGPKPKGDSAPLDRWYKEKWVNVCKPKGNGYAKCGRRQSSVKDYPYCRPSVRVSSKTPKTVSELKKERGQTGIDRICKKKKTSGTPRKGKPRRMKKV